MIEKQYPHNPNGSIEDIAAITNSKGNVLAMMPHPERALYFFQKPDWIIYKKVNGLIHLFSKKISKYDLFNVTKEIYGTNIKIKPDDNIKQDLTLNTSRTDIKYMHKNYI